MLNEVPPAGVQGEMPPPAPPPAGRVDGATDVSSMDEQIRSRVQGWAAKLFSMAPHAARTAIGELKTKIPNLGAAVEAAYNEKMRAATQTDTGATAESQASQGSQPTSEGQAMMNAEMKPMPISRAPRRSSVTGG